MAMWTVGRLYLPVLMFLRERAEPVSKADVRGWFVNVATAGDVDAVLSRLVQAGKIERPRLGMYAAKPEPPSPNAGIEEFDHADLVGLPEYHAAREALDDLVVAMTGEGNEVDQQRWLVVVRGMASTLRYVDTCCNPDHQVVEMAWPHKVAVTDGRITGCYVRRAADGGRRSI